MAQIEAVRVVQDAAYAASLSDQDWYALAQDPAWQEMVSEQSEMVAGVIAQYGNKLPGGGQSSAPTEIPVFRPFQVIGTDIARIQGYGIVTNTGTYTENLRMPGMLFMRTLRSRYPHAKIKSIDTSEAEKIPGVRKILHRGNLPEEYKDVFLGSALPTRFLFNEEVFEVGAPIAVIAADSEHIGDVAMRAIKVEYEVLPAALDMLEAMKSSTPKQFTSNLDGTTIAVTAPLVRGDPTTAKADVVVDNVARKSTEQHVALELTNSLSYWDGDKLNMTYTNQHGHGTRSGLSQALKIPQNKVRVLQTGYLGSGYGYRSGLELSEAHAAILSKLTGRPIKNNYTRYEDFVTRTHRPEFRRDEARGQPRRDDLLWHLQGHRERRCTARRRCQRLMGQHAGPLQDPEPAPRSRRRHDQQLQVGPVSLREPPERNVRPRDHDGHGRVRDQYGPGRVPAEEPQRGRQPGHEEAVQQPRYPRLHHPGGHSDQLEERLARTESQAGAARRVPRHRNGGPPLQPRRRQQPVHRSGDHQ